MKNILSTSLMLAALSLGSAFAQAQATDPSQNTAPQGQYQGHHHHQANPQHQTEMLTRKLGLSSDQSAQILQILTARDQQVQSLHQSAATSQVDPRTMHQQMRSIDEDAHTKVNALLNPQQQQQFAQLLQERHHGHHGQWQNGGQQGQQAPSSTPGV